jgi:hypothetical protein
MKGKEKENNNRKQKKGRIQRKNRKESERNKRGTREENRQLRKHSVAINKKIRSPKGTTD